MIRKLYRPPQERAQLRRETARQLHILVVSWVNGHSRSFKVIYFMVYVPVKGVCKRTMLP